VASPFFVSWWNSPADNAQTVVAAATSQVKLCPYDEEEPAIWFRLIEVQFTAAHIKSQKIRYLLSRYLLVHMFLLTYYQGLYRP
jgi:hypothetical protein